MQKIYKALFLCVFCALAVGTAQAQYQLSMYQLGKTVSQANHLNPAFMPEYTVNLSLGTNVYVAGSNNGFSFGDIFQKTGDSTWAATPGTAIERMPSINRLSVAGEAGLFQVGIRLPRYYFGLHANTRFNGALTFPKDMLGFVWFGNKPYEESGLDFSGLSVGMNAYNEIGATFAMEVTPDLTIGARAKYLQGLINLSMDPIDLGVQLNDRSLSVTGQPFEIRKFSEIADINISTAGDSLSISADLENIDYSQLSNFGSGGVAFDFGATYKITEFLEVNAAVRDLGFINWVGEGSQIYQYPGVEYEFTGFDLITVLQEAEQGETGTLSNELNKVVETFNNAEVTTGESFRAPLTGQAYVGANLRLGKIHRFGGLLYGDIYRGRLYPSLSLSYNLQIKRWFNLVASTSIINRRPSNLGLGFSVNAGPVQFFMVSDNILSPLLPTYVRNADARFGFNLTFGRVGGKSRNTNRLEGLE